MRQIHNFFCVKRRTYNNIENETKHNLNEEEYQHWYQHRNNMVKNAIKSRTKTQEANYKKNLKIEKELTNSITQLRSNILSLSGNS